MIKLTLEFKDAAEALDALFKLYGRDVSGRDKPAQTIDVTPTRVTPPAHAPVEDAAPPAVKPKRGRPKKAAAPETASARQPEPAVADAAIQTPAPAAAPTPPAENAGPSQSDALVALEKLFSKKGMDVAQATLNRYGAAKLRDLDRKNYPAFVKDCHDQVNA